MYWLICIFLDEVKRISKLPALLIGYLSLQQYSRTENRYQVLWNLIRWQRPITLPGSRFRHVTRLMIRHSCSVLPTDVLVGYDGVSRKRLRSRYRVPTMNFRITSCFMFLSSQPSTLIELIRLAYSLPPRVHALRRLQGGK